MGALVNTRHQSESFTRAILNGLQGRTIWVGDATPHKTARRRAANKVARRSRRINRLRSR